MSPAKVVRLVIVALLAMALVLSLLFVGELRRALVDFLQWVDGLGWIGYAVFALVYTIGAVLLIPGALLTLSAGAVFGFWGGYIAVTVGSLLGAAAAFLVGRTVARGWVEQHIAGSPRFRAIDQAVGREGFKIVLLTRLSPVFPYTLLNYAFSLTGISFGTFFLASWIGMLPGTVMYVYLGNAVVGFVDLLTGQASAAQQVLFYVGLAATVIVTIYITRLARSALNRTVPTEDNKPPQPAPQHHPAQPIQVLPTDSYNQELVRQVHPSDWINPQPAERYNLVVIGAGTAGLVAAAGAAGLGARVALIERELMGGDCLNVGCVPSKALIRAARAAAQVRDAGAYGTRVPGGMQVDFPAIMERMRRLRAALSPHDSAARFRRLGVDVFFGSARFTGPATVEAAGKTLRFARAVIATGARASRPPIPGLAETGYLTNETVFSLTVLPRRLAVIGAGPVGCELAQTFARFGAEVSLIGKEDRILPKEDPDAAQRVVHALKRGGVKMVLDANVLAVAQQGQDKDLRLQTPAGETVLHVDEILVGVGRAPNVAGLDLEAAGIAYDAKKGVHVTDRLRTSNRRVFAAGDICSPYKFTHAADAMARIVIRNALFLGRARASALTIPWCTYTDPEIAHVGLYEHQAKARGIPTQTFVEEFRDVDRAVLDGADDGLVKILVKKGSDEILGATVVAPHAGEMISELTLAIVGKLGLKTLAETIHPYPTQTEAFKKVADAYNRTRLTPAVHWLLARWLAWWR